MEIFGGAAERLSPRSGNTGANGVHLWITDDLKWDWYEGTIHDLRPQDVETIAEN